MASVCRSWGHSENGFDAAEVRPGAAVEARAADALGMNRIGARPQVFAIDGNAGSTALVIVLVRGTVDGGGADVVGLMIPGDDVVVLDLTHLPRVLMSVLESCVSQSVGSRRLSCGLGAVGLLLARGPAGRSDNDPAVPSVDTDVAAVGRVAARRGRVWLGSRRLGPLKTDSD